MTVHFNPREKKTGVSKCFPIETNDASSMARAAWMAIDKGRSSTARSSTSAVRDDVPLSW